MSATDRYPTAQQERAMTQGRRREVTGQSQGFSKYACLANGVMFALCFRDSRRGFEPLGDDLLARLLDAKRELVTLAEDGHWDMTDFGDTLFSVLEGVFGYHDGGMSTQSACTCDGLGECEACQAYAREMLSARRAMEDSVDSPVSSQVQRDRNQDVEQALEDYLGGQP